jgi:hypothetical protein
MLDEIEEYIKNVSSLNMQIEANKIVSDEAYKILMLQSLLLSIEEKDNFLDTIKTNNDIILGLIEA